MCCKYLAWATCLVALLGVSGCEPAQYDNSEIPTYEDQADPSTNAPTETPDDSTPERPGVRVDVDEDGVNVEVDPANEDAPASDPASNQ